MMETMFYFVVDYMIFFHIVLQECNRSLLVNSEECVSAHKMSGSRHRHVEIYLGEGLVYGLYLKYYINAVVFHTRLGSCFRT